MVPIVSTEWYQLNGICSVKTTVDQWSRNSSQKTQLYLYVGWYAIVHTNIVVFFDCYSLIIDLLYF